MPAQVIRPAARTRHRAPVDSLRPGGIAAVRARLVERHQVNPARLEVAGLGAARPREPNATIEGRARNRRVELVRDCPGGKGA